MGDEQDRFLDQARDLISELQRPSSYTILGATRDTPSSDILGAFMQAMQVRQQTGYSVQELAQAQAELKDAQKRLELDSQALDRDDWLQQLESLRNRYALFDFLADLRKQ